MSIIINKWCQNSCKSTQKPSGKYHYGMSKEKYAEQPINNPKNSIKPAQNPLMQQCRFSLSMCLLSRHFIGVVHP